MWRLATLVDALGRQHDALGTLVDPERPCDCVAKPTSAALGWVDAAVLAPLVAVVAGLCEGAATEGLRWFPEDGT